MSLEDAERIAGQYDPVVNLITHYIVYQRSVQFESGYHIMFVLLQDKKTKKYISKTRLRRPDHHHAFRTQWKEEREGERSDMMREVIATSTKHVSEIQKRAPSTMPSDYTTIVEDLSYEFPDYGEDDDLLWAEMRKSGLYDEPTDLPPLKDKDSKDNPQG